MASTNLLQAVAVTAELCGRTFSEAAARVFVSDLAAYPEGAVIAALARCRKEVRGALTVQDVVSRLDDGRPGPEEAWALLPLDEDATAVWTDEMAASWGIAETVYRTGDKTAARFAFKEAYIKRVNEARDAGRPVKWTPTLGRCPLSRWRVLSDAVAADKIPLEFARQFEPQLPAPEPIAALVSEATKRIAA
jgi:hypothetical protein